MSWLTAILNMSSVNPLPYLSDLLDGLFTILSDSRIDERRKDMNLDVRNSAQKLIDHLLEFVLQANNSKVQVAAITNSSRIIVDACLSNSTESRKNGYINVSSYST